jgi:phosphate transport system substrate-binding protein
MRENRMRLNPRHIAIALAVSGVAVATTANAARDTIQIAGVGSLLFLWDGESLKNRS